MTEQEWLASTDPAAMLESVRGKVSDRKLRLLAVAVTRMALAMRRKASSVMLEDVETAERFADGLASESDMVIARISSNLWCCNEYADIAAVGSAVMVRDRATETADLLRDIVGNPFRRVALPKSWVKCHSCGGKGWYADTSNANSGYCPCFCRKGQQQTGPCLWLTPDAVSLAQTAYADRDPSTGRLAADRLAVLADALEEAGCPQTIKCHRCDGNGQQFVSLADGGIICKDGVVRSGWKDCSRCDGSGVEPHPLLAHLRSPGPHVRGCWAVDLVLERG